MDKRNEYVIIKAADPEKVVVFRAESLENEIRFFINETQYITGIEHENGEVSIEQSEISLKKSHIKKSKLDLIKENPEKIIKPLFLICFIYTIAMTLSASALLFFDNILIYFFIFLSVFFIIKLIYSVSLGSLELTLARKSKHSAEHMLVNFIERNKRLPKNMAEIKKSSRFSPGCGSKSLINGLSEIFIAGAFAAVLSAIVSSCVSYFYDNIVLNVIILPVFYYIVYSIVCLLIRKFEKMKIVIEPVEKLLTNIAQLATTNKKVEDKDIILAYRVASVWFQVVYPEFYNKDEDVFLEQLKVNIKT